MKKTIRLGTEQISLTDSEISKMEIYLESLSRCLERIKEAAKSHNSFEESLFLSLLFSDAQPLADFSRIACKRMGRETTVRDALGLVKSAKKTLDLN